MIFSTFAWGYTLLCAAASGALAALLTAWSFQRLDDGDARRPNSKAAAIFASGVSLFIGRLVMYYVQPVFQGSYGGHWFTLFVVLVPAVGAAFLFSRGSRKVFYTLGMLFLLVVVPSAQYIWTCCGPYNMQKFAKLPNIKVAAADAKIPPTEANHLVLVPDSVAIFQGQSALGAKGTQYEINERSYTLQSVRGHRYWIAPLTYHNFVDQINLGQPSPGYVVVDAENPEADATLKLGYKIRLFTDQWWNLNLERFLYRQGFQGGALTPVKFEVDDNWEPHYVVGYVQKKFGGGMGGDYLSKVIIVNVSQEEPTFTVYDASEHSKFAWVDRAMPTDVVWEYAKNYGKYSSDFAKDNPWAIWWGWSKEGAMRPGDMELNYTKADENVWVIPMTSVASSNTSVMGVLVFETNRNEGTFYPGLNNFNIGDTVKTTMFNAPANVKHYDVEHIQLVSIFGELTWVGIYTAEQDHGRSFVGIGLLHCHGQKAGDVVFASNRNEALVKYRVQLGAREASNEKISDNVKRSPSTTGKIFRVVVDGQTAQFAITGDTTHVYVVSREMYIKAALLRDGDEVTFNYLDTDSPQVVITSLHCKALDGADKK